MAHLPGINLCKRTDAAISHEDWKEALVAARADVAQYTIFHLTNTAPRLKDDPVPKAPLLLALLEADVQELSDCVATLCSCYDQLGMHDDAFAILDRIQKNIGHLRWGRRLGYVRSLHALSDVWDEDAGRTELAKLGSMEVENDVEILQLYLDLYGREIGLSEKLTLADRVITLSKKEGDKLHYRGFKAITFLTFGDVVGARRELMGAISLYRLNAPAGERTLHGRQLFVTTLILAGILNGGGELLNEAAAEITELLALSDWAPAGLAHLIRQRGDVCRHMGKWEDAKVAYMEAMRSDARAINQVFVAQSTLFADGAVAAVPAIQDVDASLLDPEEYIDYILVLANVAIESGNRKLLVVAESLLRTVDVDAPYFRKQCDDLLIAVIDTKRTGPTAERSRKVRTILSGALFRFTRYVKLEPNVMGFGLNIGKIIDDANDRFLKVSE